MSSFTGADPSSAWARIERGLATIEHPHNRELVETYLNERYAGGVKLTTIGSDMSLLKTFCAFLGDTDLEGVERKQRVSFLNQAKQVRQWVNRDQGGQETIAERTVPIKDSTRHQRKIRLRSFYKWLLETDDEPQLFKGLRMKRPSKDPIPTDQLITKRDLNRLI